MSEQTTTKSPYLNETDELIVRAAAEILRRSSNEWHDRVMDADVKTSEIMNIAAMQAKMEVASGAIYNALIALQVNAEHYHSEAS